MLVATPGHSTDYAAWFLSRLSGEFPLFFAKGNHEFRAEIYPETYGAMYPEFCEQVKDSGMIMLSNSSAEAVINGLPLQVTAIEIPREYYSRFGKQYKHLPLKEFIDEKPAGSRISILLAHNPKYASSYLKWGADLTLCGHYHGGIVRLKNDVGLVSPALRPFTKLAHGLIERNGKSLIISAGLGEHTLPLRINNPRELVVFEIENRHGDKNGSDTR